MTSPFQLYYEFSRSDPTGCIWYGTICLIKVVKYGGKNVIIKIFPNDYKSEWIQVYVHPFQSILFINTAHDTRIFVCAAFKQLSANILLHRKNLVALLPVLLHKSILCIMAKCSIHIIYAINVLMPFYTILDAQFNTKCHNDQLGKLSFQDTGRTQS